MRLWDFYELEGLGKKSKQFLSFLEFFMNDHSIFETLEMLRTSGVCFNPYNPNSNGILDELMLRVEEKYPEDKNLIQEFRNTIEALRNIFKEFLQVRESRKLNSIPSDRRLLSFIVSLEIWLGSTIEYIQGHPLPRIKEVYPFIVTLFDEQKSLLVSADKGNIQARTIVDSVAESASSILKYLQYENGPIQKLHHLHMNQVRLARQHIELFDVFSSLLNLEQKWRFSNAEVVERSNNYEIQLRNEKFLLAQETSRLRFRSQRSKWMADFSQAKIKSTINSEAEQLAPIQYLCEDEVFFSIAIGEFLLTHDLDIKCLDVSLSEWIRAYTIIQLEAKKELEKRFNKRQVPPISLQNWTIFKEKSFWKTLFLARGISSSSCDVIIDKLTFRNNSRDLLDCPFIELGEYLIVIPTIATVIDPSMSLVSLLVSNNIDVSFKGTGLEEDILRKLNDRGIRAKGLKQTRDGETFECDAAFKLDNDLFLIEIKAFGQPSSVRDYYSLLLKLVGPQQRISITNNERSSIEQLSRIASFYEENMEVVNKELNLPDDWAPDKVYKVVLTTALLGEPLFVENTFIVDHSVFIRFLDRNPPAFAVKNVRFRPKVEEFEGNITSEKLINVLRNPPQVALGNKRLKIYRRRIPLEKNTVDYPFFDVALGDFIQLDKKVLKILGIDEKQLQQLLQENNS